MNYVSIPMKSQGHKQYHKAYEYDPKICCELLRIFQLPKCVAEVYQICKACSGIHNRFKSLLFMFCDVVEVSDYTPGRLHHPQSTRRCDQDTFSVSSYHHISGCGARTSHVAGAPQFAVWHMRSRFILSFYPTIDKEQRLGMHPSGTQDLRAYPRTRFQKTEVKFQEKIFMVRRDGEQEGGPLQGRLLRSHLTKMLSSFS